MFRYGPERHHFKCSTSAITHPRREVHVVHSTAVAGPERATRVTPRVRGAAHEHTVSVGFKNSVTLGPLLFFSYQGCKVARTCVSESSHTEEEGGLPPRDLCVSNGTRWMGEKVRTGKLSAHGHVLSGWSVFGGVQCSAAQYTDMAAPHTTHTHTNTSS